MKELYFLTRLDMISGWAITFSVLLGGVSLIAIIAYFVMKCDYNNYGGNDVRRWCEFWKSLFKKVFPAFILFFIISIFTPTTKEAYMIYGIGGTIDYIRNDSTAVQIPHKVIEAVDMWIDDIKVTEK